MVFRHALIVLTCSFTFPAAASDVVWSVVNPFRYYKHEDSFEVHKAAYDAILAQNGGGRPQNIVEQIERRLNTADCADPLNYDVCAANPLPGAKAGDQLGWASRNIGASDANGPSNKKCYGKQQVGGSEAYRYFESCERDTGDGRAARLESYVTPAFHAVRVALAAAQASSRAGISCDWKFTSAAKGTVDQSAPCDSTVLFSEVPYPEGGALEVLDPQGRRVAQEPIQVRDALVLGLGDSYASGEGNPDRPVRLARAPANADFDGFPHASQGLPVRKTQPQIYLDSMSDGVRDDLEYAARARWTSPDCHRSQYSYQFRVALELALEDPHRAVTLIHLACSGAEALNGVFRGEAAREAARGEATSVVAELQQAQELLCAKRSSDQRTYLLQTPDVWGKPNTHFEKATLARCLVLKRPVDLVLLSLGGNDVGFSGLVGYTFIPDAGAVAPIAGAYQAVTGNPFIFGPVCNGPYCAYLPMMQQRLIQTGYALQEALAISPAKVVQTSYERIPVDENDKPCQGGRGLDIFEGFKFDQAKVANALAFGKRFLNRLACSTAPTPAISCRPGDYKTATKFHFIDAGARFAGRGICAASGALETAQFRVPHMNADGSQFLGFQPENYFPFAHRTRLFVAADDSFLAANTQAGYPNCFGTPDQCPPPGDRLQLVWRGLYGGAFHRTAEAHAIVADTVLNLWARAAVNASAAVPR
jgi:hypothetical protein